MVCVAGCMPRQRRRLYINFSRIESFSGWKSCSGDGVTGGREQEQARSPRPTRALLEALPNNIVHYVALHIYGCGAEYQVLDIPQQYHVFGFWKVVVFMHSSHLVWTPASRTLYRQRVHYWRLCVSRKWLCGSCGMLYEYRSPTDLSTLPDAWKWLKKAIDKDTSTITLRDVKIILGYFLAFSIIYYSMNEVSFPMPENKTSTNVWWIHVRSV